MLFSVFTHFYLPDVERYLAELHRVVRPGGHVLASWFLYDDATLEHVRSHSAYPMRLTHDEHTVYHLETDPLRAIAHHEARVRQLVDQARFEVVRIEHGRWKHAPGPEFQDMVVLRRRHDPWRERLTPARVAASLRRRLAERTARRR